MEPPHDLVEIGGIAAIAMGLVRVVEGLVSKLVQRQGADREEAALAKVEREFHEHEIRDAEHRKSVEEMLKGLTRTAQAHAENGARQVDILNRIERHLERS